MPTLHLSEAKVETKNPRRKMEDGWQHYWLRNGRGTKDPSSIDHTSSQTVMWVCRHVNLVVHRRLSSRVNSRKKPKTRHATLKVMKAWTCCDHRRLLRYADEFAAVFSRPERLCLIIWTDPQCSPFRHPLRQSPSMQKGAIEQLLMRERREMLIRHFHNLKKPETIESH